MRMMKLSSLLVSIWVSIALGDYPSDLTTTNNTCESSLVLPANATGVQDGGQYSSSNGLGYWKVAVSTNSSAENIEQGRDLTQSSPGAVANVWLDTFEDIDLTDGSNSFSACGYILKELPYNTMLRGQDDDGTCERTLSKKCIEAITSRAAETAKWLVQSPTQGPFSNLTPPILGPICQDIIAGVGIGPDDSQNPFPSECTPLFENGNNFYPVADVLVMTSNKSLPQNCTFDPSTNSQDFIEVTSYNAPIGMRYPFNSTDGSAMASYDELVQQVWPILTVVFAPANNSRMSAMSGAEATMTCIRAGTSIKANSRTPAALPKAKAVHFPLHLSKGAIAGIVVGAIVVAATIVGAIWWFWKRRESNSQSEISGNEDKDLNDLLPAEKGAGNIYHLDSKGISAQLDSSQRMELQGEDGSHELASSIPPQELPGNIPDSPTK